MNNFDTIIIGGGPAGMEAAARLSKFDKKVLIIEKDSNIGGKLLLWDRLFPDFASSEELLNQLLENVKTNNVEVAINTDIKNIEKDGNNWIIEDSNNIKHSARTVLISTGFDVFDASRKEEYGYGIYPNVITSVDLEKILSKEVEHAEPKKVVFIQCVGSRDEKVGNHFCSKNCCICAVKQAIEVKEMYPETEVYCFYMDLRMFGESYEELYRTAQQEHGITFIRGRVSEISPTFDGQVQIKAEDTLLSRPIRLTTDLVVLMVGMEASEGTAKIGKQLNINGNYNYIKSKNQHIADNLTALDGIFVAGTSKRQMSIPETMKDAATAALEINNYLNS
ncbi:FAD-dependent oxidoreductase [Bacteroidales bacterium OttesenSCG-928-K03]|nr:FAD-dependent oxidoreductase [Odoribacter sp. OttesenSCG-928-L07]MDL2239107.1 FAD-dependent oxidoreductase [Bacteroidales bacterium OttesenSCG-928-L14]MDL2240020.1 FAD-dependent oxidoreductase [Bacteroidales bacterium OttesenSCG-928-K22]MDL2242268.1 FAD-dependent oxidoreductase [Bacteroidales bacterium OttesenSCG-928-K03]